LPKNYQNSSAHTCPFFEGFKTIVPTWSFWVTIKTRKVIHKVSYFLGRNWVTLQTNFHAKSKKQMNIYLLEKWYNEKTHVAKFKRVTKTKNAKSYYSRKILLQVFHHRFVYKHFLH